MIVVEGNISIGDASAVMGRSVPGLGFDSQLHLGYQPSLEYPRCVGMGVAVETITLQGQGLGYLSLYSGEGGLTSIDAKVAVPLIP